MVFLELGNGHGVRFVFTNTIDSGRRTTQELVAPTSPETKRIEAHSMEHHLTSNEMGAGLRLQDDDEYDEYEDYEGNYDIPFDSVPDTVALANNGSAHMTAALEKRSDNVNEQQTTMAVQQDMFLSSQAPKPIFTVHGHTADTFGGGSRRHKSMHIYNASQNPHIHNTHIITD